MTSVFVNAAHLYIRMKMTEEAAATQVAWVLSYVQGGIAEAWKDNLLDELAKEKSCKNLGQDVLELLLVQVNKENLMEFSFDFGTLLIHILCLLLFTKSCASPLGCSTLYIQQFSN